MKVDTNLTAAGNAGVTKGGDFFFGFHGGKNKEKLIHFESAATHLVAPPVYWGRDF